MQRQRRRTPSRTRSQTRSRRSRSLRPSLKYVVFAGGDDQIPFFRIPDLSRIANESGFAGQFNNNEYYGALASGDLLTDNPYLDTRPVPASGRQLFIPDLAGGRLVETPTQIANAVTSFENSNGTLRSSTAFVSGYDFVTDGSQTVAQRLQSILGATSVNSLIDTTTPFVPATSWSKNGLLNAAFPPLGQAAINDWNGHYDNTRALMANGDLLSTSELTGDPRLLRRHLPHDGLPRRLPDDRRDHRDARARLGAVLRRHRHGLRGQHGLRARQHGQRRLLRGADGDFAGHLDRTVSIGQALNLAKEDYFLSRDAFSSYDEKTLSEAELYGLPMYGVGAPAGTAERPGARSPAPLPDPVSGTASSTSPSQACSARSRRVRAGRGLRGHPHLLRPGHRPARQLLHERRPGSGAELPAAPAVRDAVRDPHGPDRTRRRDRQPRRVEDHTGFNPDNVRPTLDLTANEPEPQFTDQAWPTKVPTLVSLTDPNGLQQRLNLTTGQFFTVRERRHGDRAALDADRRPRHLFAEHRLRAADRRPDRRLPHRQHRDLHRALQRPHRNGSRRHRHVRPGRVRRRQHRHLEERAARAERTGAWSGGAPFTGTHVQFFAEACDAAGNCGYSSNKGRYFDAVPLPTSTGSITLTPSGTLGTGGWYTTTVNVTGDELDAGRHDHA